VEKGNCFNMGDEPERQCPCGAGACRVLTSHSKDNPNRRFYKCATGDKCAANFFEWIDPDPDPGPGLGPAREWECMAREQLAKGLEVAGRRYEGPTRTLRVTVAPDAHTLTLHFCTAS
jgi:hypothetical protein